MSSTSGSSSGSRSSSPSSGSSADSRSSSPVSSSASDSEQIHPAQLGKRKRKDALAQAAAPDAVDEDEVPVLSHAEKRRQKKKQKLPGAAPDADAPSSSKKSNTSNTEDVSASGPAIPKRQNSVWVGNLSFKTTEESLKTFFEGVGDITRVHLPMKAQPAGQRGPGVKKENRGFAYVDFASPDAKVIAIAMSEHNLDGRRLLIKDGDDFTGRPTAAQPDAPEGAQTKSKFAQKVLAAQKQPPAPTVFFGNLSFESTEEGIREMLVAHSIGRAAKGKKRGEDEIDEADKKAKRKKGEEDEEMQEVDEKTPPSAGIRKIRVGTFEDSGKCKGWAFVDFDSVDAATAALIHPKNHKLDGRDLKVEYASAEAVRRGGGSSLMPGFNVDKRIGNTEERRPHRQGPRQQKLARRAAQQPTEELPSGERTAKKRKVDDSSGEGRHIPEEDGRHGEKARGKERFDRKGKPRTRPGAALALARRESVAIKPSEGSKIVF